LKVSCRGLSRVAMKRVPMAIPSAPRASAAARPRPSAKPPAAITGIFTASTMLGTRTRLVTSPPWAAASWPVTRRASVPYSSARCAWRRLTTVATTLPPYSWAALTSQSPFPREKLMTGTFSSRRTLALRAAPGKSSVAFAPKGLSVSLRISRMAARVSSGCRGPVARIPKPPALDTAATMLGTLIQLMPERTIGYRTPNSSVIFVFITSLPRPSKLTAGRLLTAGHHFHESRPLSRGNCRFRLREQARVWQVKGRKSGSEEHRKSGQETAIFFHSSALLLFLTS